MKIKVTIPAQSLRIEIPAQEIEVDFELVPPVDPPIEPPIEEVLDLDKFLQGKSGVIHLPKSVTVVRSKGLIKPKQVTALVGSGQTPTFENWDVTPTQLFDLSGCQEFAVVGITFVCPPNRPIKTGFPDKELFGWERDSVTEGKFAWISGPEVLDKERVTFGLFRFGYSSNSINRIFLIGKNVHHNGFNFTQVKNPYKGNLWLILQNVTVHNPIIEYPQSHYYSPTRIKVRFRVQDGIAKIISDNTFDQILTWAGYNNGNQRSIILFDRFAYDISENKLIDNKTLIIDYPDELHPGDVTENGEVLTKQIDESRKTNWVYTYEATDKKFYRALPEGEFEGYIVYKGNAAFQTPITKDTKFKPGYWTLDVFTMSQGYGWSWYNEEVSGYIENFKGSGYFRNSGGSGITQGLTIRNSTFEQNPPIATADENIPDEAQKYIEYLEQLF